MVGATMVDAWAKRNDSGQFPPALYVINQDCTQPVKTMDAGIASLVQAVVISLQRRNPDAYSNDPWNLAARERAFAADLNGDITPEYFVPLSCGGTGDCTWGVFYARPLKFLGLIQADRIYIRKRSGSWSAVTGELSFSVAESDVATYLMKRGRYRQVTSWKHYDSTPSHGGPFLPGDMLRLLKSCKAWTPLRSGMHRY